MAVQCLHGGAGVLAAAGSPTFPFFDDGAGVDTVRALQHLQSRLARLDRERHEANSCAAALREDIAARELELARLAAEADAADAPDDGTVDDEDDADEAAVIAAAGGRRGDAPRRGPARGRDRPAGGGGGGARPATSGESRRPAASGESCAAYRGGARAAKPATAPARPDRRAAAVEFVRAAGHLRGRGALDAGAAAPAGAGPSFFLGLSRAWHTA